MDSGSIGGNLKEGSPTCLWSSMPTSSPQEAHLGSLQRHWTCGRASWTPWCRYDAVWTQQWLRFLQTGLSKAPDGIDLHVSKVHTLVSHAGHQRSLWSWLGWTVETSTMRSTWIFARSFTGVRWSMEPMLTLNILIEVLPGTLLLLPICQVNALHLINANTAPLPQLMMLKFQSWNPPPFRPPSARCVASCPSDALATTNMPDLKVGSRCK